MKLGQPHSSRDALITISLGDHCARSYVYDERRGQEEEKQHDPFPEQPYKDDVYCRSCQERFMGGDVSLC